jgi:FkbM family methyltransferase
MNKYSIKQNIINLFPKQLHLPFRYHYSKFKGRLEPEIFYLKQLVRNGKRAIDVGASRGYYTYALSKLCDVVESFEPQKWACEAITAYNASNVNCYNVGLSNFNGNLELNIPIVNGTGIDAEASFRKLSGNQNSILVPVHKLDDYEFQDVSFIKIDVEGYEVEVIQGAIKTISANKPVILVEIEQRHLMDKSLQTVFDEIIKLGYQGTFLSKNKFVPLSEFSYATHQQPYLDEILRYGHSEKYINNFIFQPVEMDKLV